MSTGGLACADCSPAGVWLVNELGAIPVLAAAGIVAPTQTLGLIKVTASQVRQQVVNVQQRSAGLLVMRPPDHVSIAHDLCAKELDSTTTHLQVMSTPKAGPTRRRPRKSMGQAGIIGPLATLWTTSLQPAQRPRWGCRHLGFAH